MDYKKSWSRWLRVYNTKYGEYYYNHVYKFIKKCIIFREIKNILDIGGGQGRFALPLSDDGYRVTVLDITYDCKKFFDNTNIQFIHGDFFSKNIKKDYHHLFLCIGTIKYLRSFDEFMNRISKISPSNSYLLIELLNPYCFRSIIAEKLFGKARCNYQVSYNECRRLLKKYNYKLIGKHFFLSIVPSYRTNNYLFNLIKYVEQYSGLNKVLFFNYQYLIFAQKC